MTTLPMTATTVARDRLLHGLAASIRARGYRETTIADIVGHARTSRRTFYEVFATKDECFIALVTELSQQMMAHIESAVDPDDPWERQVRCGVTAWVDAVRSQPELSVSWFRELPYLGPMAARAHHEAQVAFRQLLMRLFNTPKMLAAGVPPVTETKATILLGGLRELVAAVVETGDDLTTIIEPAVDAAVGLLGPRPQR